MSGAVYMLYLFQFLDHSKVNMQAREKKIDGEKLHQAITYFLKKSSEEKLFNFTLKLNGSSSLMPLETLISTRYYAKQPNANPIAKEFKNPKEYLEKAAPNCGSFAKGFFKFLTGLDSNLYKQPKHKTTSELQALVKEKKDFPYAIYISLPQHIYIILVTTCNKDGKPQGYIYQTNTDKDMAGEMFSLQHWIRSKKNTSIDVLDHLSKVDILLDSTESPELKKKIYEMLYTIPVSDEVKTLKNLDKLVTSPEGKVRWNIGNVVHNAQERLASLYQESIKELNKLKIFFDIPPENDFVAMFSEKLQNKEIILEENPDLETAVKHLFERRNIMEPKDNNNVTTTPANHQQTSKITPKKYRHGYSYFGGVEDSDSENEEKLSNVKSLETSTEHPKVQSTSPRTPR